MKLSSYILKKGKTKPDKPDSRKRGKGKDTPKDITLHLSSLIPCPPNLLLKALTLLLSPLNKGRMLFWFLQMKNPRSVLREKFQNRSITSKRMLNKVKEHSKDTASDLHYILSTEEYHVNEYHEENKDDSFGQDGPLLQTVRCLMVYSYTCKSFSCDVVFNFVPNWNYYSFSSRHVFDFIPTLNFWTWCW